MDTFGVKGASDETFCPIIALHIESCRHIQPPEDCQFAPKYRYLYHTLTKLLVKCLSEHVLGVFHFFLRLSSDRATSIASRFVFQYWYHLYFSSVRISSVLLINYPPLVGISSTG